jgi:hypothetical protein
MGAVAPLGPPWELAGDEQTGHGGAPEAWGIGLGAHWGIWRTQPRAPRRRESTIVRCTRRGGLTAARGNSGEHLRVN